jgi:hypothetical protein
MVNVPVQLGFSSVMTVVRSAVNNYRIHAAKVRIYFVIRMSDLEFIFGWRVTLQTQNCQL